MNIFLTFIIGSIFGSYLNVWVDRIPKGKSIHYPNSHCNSCNHELRWNDLIPILSYLILKGKCRYCGEKYPGKQTLIEILTAILFGFSYIRFGFSYEMIRTDCLIVFLMALSLIDMATMLLPTKIIHSGLISAIILTLGNCIVQQTYMPIIGATISSILIYLLWYFIYILSIKIFKKECMGMGDIRLFAMIAFFIPEYLLLIKMVYIASFSALLFAMYLILFKKNKKSFPFGPFISLGTIIAIFL